MGFPLKPLTGLWGFPPFSNATQCAPGECGADPDWELPLDEGIAKVSSCSEHACLSAWCALLPLRLAGSRALVSDLPLGEGTPKASWWHLPMPAVL